MSNQEQELEQSAELINDEQQTPDVAEPAVATDELSALQQQLSAAEAAAQEEKDRALRIAAEMENLRRRAAQDVEKAHKFALEKFAGDLLAVVDSLERGLELSSAENEAIKPVREGMQLTLKLLTDTLKRYQVEQVDPLGEPFNPEHHQAMAMEESLHAEPGSVLKVFQKGYLLSGRLLRPAMVVVSKAPAVAQPSIDEQA